MKVKRYLTFAAILLTSSLSAFANNNEKIPGATVQDAAFFTGKPYDVDLESYVFNYRNYNAEIGRWTTADPSGFPDGANIFFYAPIPTREFDFEGRYAVQNTFGVGDAYIQMSNIATNASGSQFGSITGMEVYVGHEGESNRQPQPLDGQCASGAQFLCGTISGSLHDSPRTNTWNSGAHVQGNNGIQPGTMIAAGWNSGGKYLSLPSGNHTAIYLSQNSTGVTVFDQYVGKKLGISFYSWSAFGTGTASWSIVTSNLQKDPNKSISFLE